MYDEDLSIDDVLSLADRGLTEEDVAADPQAANGPQYDFDDPDAEIGF